jgi:hypothetical protein
MEKRSILLLIILTMASTLGVSQNNTVLNSVFMNKTGEYRVRIIQDGDDCQVNISRDDGKSESITHFIAKASSFTYVVPGFANDHLTIIWGTGNSTYVTAFPLTPGEKAHAAFSENTDAPPEFVQVNSSNGESRQVMLLYSGRSHVADYWFPETAALYSWDGGQYQLLRTVPYISRFEALRGLQSLKNVPTKH